MRKLLFLIPALLLAISCNKPAPAPSDKPLNIILLIGDGMGLTQISTLYYYGEDSSHFSRFRHIGLHQTIPARARITDSAAGATAFSTGYKSYNGAIGVDADTISRETILEIAARQGKHTGLIATSSITHATPASFYAHVPSREMHEEIAASLHDAPVHFVAGGGRQYFASRQDGQNLLDTLSARGVVVDTSQLGQNLSPDTRYAFLLAPDGMFKMREGRGNFLPDATKLALDLLSQNDKGFFLMVEGSQIDWGGHDNDANYIIEEMQDFNRAIGLALDFAEKDGNTLVIVTADHECGGFALGAPEVFGQRDYRTIQPKFTTMGHTATLLPIFAYGPGAERFMGVYQNNEVFGKMGW
jgi:alkaline phosphatase